MSSSARLLPQKTIAVLGATGSVGRQALDVAAARGYLVDFLSADRSVDGIEALARRFSPRLVAMANDDAARDLAARLADTQIRVLSGAEGILAGIRESRAETVVNATLGEAGLLPSLEVLRAGRRLALANKESLVIAGRIVMQTAAEHGAQILPVDSEHSAIFQSLLAGKRGEIKRILLTASGGPFYGKSREELSRVTLADALAHPTWKMGKKITVDSATMMNKGFEIIEACHLFGTSADRVEVLIHRESILHSAVEYIDHSVIGEFAVPDMRACVQYAVDYPDRAPAVIEQIDWFRLGSLTFRRPDEQNFPLLPLARRAMSDGGGMCAVLNAADEVAVAAFLSEKISFFGICEVVEAVYSHMPDARRCESLDEILAADRAARAYAGEAVAACTRRKA